MDDDEQFKDEEESQVEEAHVEPVDEVDPTDRKPLLFDDRKGIFLGGQIWLDL